jgi:hypothetical protein
MVGDPILQKLKVIAWSKEAGKGAVRDQKGCMYPALRSDLAEGVEDLQEGEFVEGIIVSFDRVSHVQLIGYTERKEFDSVGPDPETRGWDPHKPGVTPGIGHIRLGK